MSKQSLVIVGASLAGAKAAQELRDRGFDGDIRLIGAETERPYERPPLSKDHLRGESERQKAFVRDDGYSLSFDKLLLAAGAEPRRIEVPGAGDRDAGEFVAFWLRDNRVIAGMNVSVWDVNERVQPLIRSRQPVDPAALRDTDTPLGALLSATATEAW